MTPVPANVPASIPVPAAAAATIAPRGPALRFEDVSISFGNHVAVRGVNLDVPALQVTTLVGPSGCGKTTLLQGGQPSPRPSWWSGRGPDRARRPGHLCAGYAR